MPYTLLPKLDCNSYRRSDFERRFFSENTMVIPTAGSPVQEKTTDIAETTHKWLSKYNVNGPRYTSYPTALEFDQTISKAMQMGAAVSSQNNALSLYFHIPFCHQLCYYCGCNKIVTRHQHKADKYLDHMLAELNERSVLLAKKPVVQIHFGGGTPNFLTPQQFDRIFSTINSLFEVSDNAEISVELDIRHVDRSLLLMLKNCGVNRLSFGIQDTNEKVQKAINRIQTNETLCNVMGQVDKVGFDSVNFDLIYGLPHQTRDVFAQTLNDVVAFQPDRISLFSYAHIPQRFSSQRKIKDEWLPSAQNKLQLMLDANDFLCGDAGYIAVGFDHFAKSSDSLVTAQNEGNLHRNFQGYTVLEDTDLLAVGVSSISQIGELYLQNPKSLKDYYGAGSANKAPCKGRKLTRDDAIRAHVIKDLMCNFELDLSTIDARWNIDSKAYFENELASLAMFQKDGLLHIDGSVIKVDTKARMFVRNICMSFDSYLAKQLNQRRFSQVI
jgi:oxygen-independent coproporphyrinogen III oxidase